MNSISTTCTAEINVIDVDVDVGTNATTLVLLMDSDVRPVYAAGAPNENVIQNHLNIALLNVFQYLNGRYGHIFIP